MNLVSPVFFNPNRVRRLHKAGGLLNDFLDGVAPDGGENFSEEWFVSVTPCLGNEKNKKSQEGISEVIDGDGFGSTPLPEFLAANADSLFGADFVIRYGRDFPLQLRLIDSDESSPLQIAPKPKAWIVIDTDEADAADPCIMLGFKEGVTSEAVAEAMRLGDGRLEMMTHSIPVNGGDVFFIPPGMPHAIGSGILLYEVQPADNPDGSPEAGDIATYTREDLLREVRGSNHTLKRNDDGHCSEVIGTGCTKDFLIWGVEVAGKMEIKLPRPFAGVLCTGGEGNISYAGGVREIKKGDFFLQPFGVPWIEYNTDPGERLSLIITMPPG